MPPPLSRDQLAEKYFEQLPFTPYPLQEEAILSWFTADEGVMVCCPTGTGKTLIAEAALFEALHLGQTAYYTTPLIALTEQKFHEMQAAAVRWGFAPDDVGLVTGNRKENPNAKILVVVAEILLNRLLHPEAFDFTQVGAVVMDELHSFSDPERGMVWEFSLSLLPPQVRLMLLSATVGNAFEFLLWLDRFHKRKLQLVEGKERKVPLVYEWVEDDFLADHVEKMAKAAGDNRRVPALVFCFNRDECWTVAEQLKGKSLLGEAERHKLAEQMKTIDWSRGVGPKLKQLIQRGVGVHHAGLLPRYRRIVEKLFQQRLLAVTMCTETLAAGINLPARSVVLSSLVKGPPGKQKLIDPTTAHQIFGRAGRPQFDSMGYVVALAHEDDVRLLRWKIKYDSIPEETKDPGLLKAKKDLKRKKPSRRENVTYWTEAQFEKLKTAEPQKLVSKGALPWRFLAYLLRLSPEVDRVRSLLRKRLMPEPKIAEGEKLLNQMLLTLHKGGFATLDPPPPAKEAPEKAPTMQQVIERVNAAGAVVYSVDKSAKKEDEASVYRPTLCHLTPKADRLLLFRSIHPIYGSFLVDLLAMANRDEKTQALESVLELPGPVLKYVRVPFDLPPGPLATEVLDPELVELGLMAATVKIAEDEEEEAADDQPWEERPPSFAEKLRLLFGAHYPELGDLRTQAVWCAGDLVAYGGDFDAYVKSRDATKQEGILFRHLLRLILLCGEFADNPPEDVDRAAWASDFVELAAWLTNVCQEVDPNSTGEILSMARAADLVAGESAATPPQ